MKRVPIPKYLRNRTLMRDGYKCLNCGRGIKTAVPLPPGVTLDVHHHLGNSHELPTLDGLRTLCSECNRSLGSKLISLPLTNEPRIEVDLRPVIEAITKLRSPVKPKDIPFIPYCYDIHCVKYKGEPWSVGKVMSEYNPFERMGRE